jgi:hypothetical protein
VYTFKIVIVSHQSALILKSSTPLLGRHSLLNSLGTSVCLVHLGPLCKNGRLQIATVKVGDGVFPNGRFDTSEILVHGNGSGGLLWRCVALGGRLDNQLSTIIFGTLDTGHFGIGKSRILELIQRGKVSLFSGKLNFARSLGVTILLLQEASVSLGKLPSE